MNRMRFERDILVVPGVGADRSEPMEEGGMVTKLGFDATARSADRAEGVDKATPPTAVLSAARAWLQGAVVRERRPWLAD